MPSLCATQAYLFNNTYLTALPYKPIPPPESLSNDFTSFIAFTYLPFQKANCARKVDLALVLFQNHH